MLRTFRNPGGEDRIPASIGARLSGGIGLMLLPFVALLIGLSFYAIHVVHNQVAGSYAELMDLYVEDVDGMLDNATRWLIGMVASDEDLEIVANGASIDIRMLAKIRFLNNANADLQNLGGMENFFLVGSDGKEFDMLRTNDGTLEERSRMQAWVTSHLADGTLPVDNRASLWHNVKLGDQWYVLQVMRRNTIHIGMWMRTDRLMASFLARYADPRRAFLLTDDSGSLLYSDNSNRMAGIDLNRDWSRYYVDGGHERFLIVGKSSRKAEFNLVAIIPDRSILEKLPRMLNIAVFLAFGSLLIFPLLALLLRGMVLRPLKTLVTAMKRLRGGDMETRIAPDGRTEEFRLVFDTFNAMAGQIRQLRIDVYEEQLHSQKAELERLQMQVNPHFFLNSLNIIHSFAQTRNYRLVQEMTQCLVKYFRFMFRSDHDSIPLDGEIEHVRNYLRIQELRMQDAFRFTIEVGTGLGRANIPPLLILSFVENSIKYARRAEVPMTLDIRAARDPEDGGMLRVEVLDNGPGIDEAVLERLNRGDMLTSGDREQIGVRNVQRRLALMYGGKAGVRLENRETGGVRVVVRLPAGDGAPDTLGAADAVGAPGAGCLEAAAISDIGALEAAAHDHAATSTAMKGMPT